ncbi:hypothetical protein ABPG74_002417 [Tetrahymena malaccensis]
MKKYYGIVAITSILILIVMISVILNFYYTTQYQKKYIADITNHLFDVQTKHNSIFTAIICHQISLEVQKIPTYTNMLNNFIAKMLNGSLVVQHNYTNSLVNYYLLQKNEVDSSISLMVSKSSQLINNWQSDQFYLAKDLEQETQSYLQKLSQYNILQRPIQYTNSLFQSERSIFYDNIFYATQQQDLILNSRNNTIFDHFLSDQCSIDGFNTNNLRCQAWYQSIIDQTQILFLSPKLVNILNSSQIAQLHCSQLQQFINNQNKNKPIVICIQTIISKLQNYFINQGNKTHNTFLIESSSQIIIYKSNPDVLNTTNLQYLYELEYQNNMSSSTEYLSTTVSNYLQNITNFLQNNNTSIYDELIQQQQQIRFQSNNNQIVILLSPIIVKSFRQNQKNESSQFINNNNLKIPYLVINTLQEDCFNGWKQNLNSNLDTILITSIVGFTVLSIFITFLIYFYLFRHFFLIDIQVEHLIHILKLMAAQKFNYEVAQKNTKNMFNCFETKLLFQGFQTIYQILLYTSENFFDSNNTETLIKLNKNLKFFKDFGNKHAEGITFNNIGTLLMAKGHLFESLECFTSSIICARYEIQQFCKENPISLTTFLISEFGYQNNIEELISQSDQRFSIKLLKQKSRSSTSKYSFSQKTAFSSIKQQKQQTTTTSQQMHMDLYLQEKARQFNQYLRGKNLRIPNNNLEGINDQFQEQRLFLLYSLYSRYRNLLVCLLLANQVQKDFFKFWDEIIEILNFMTKISEQLPQRDLLIYELNIVRYRANFELNKINELSNIEKQIENIIVNNKQQKEQILFNSYKNRQIQQQSEIKNQIKLFQDSSSSFFNQNSQGLKLNELSPVKKSLINQTEKQKIFQLQKSLSSKNESQLLLNQSSPVYKFILKLNDTKKIFFEDKMQKNRQRHLNLSDTSCKNLFVNKVNEIIVSSKQQKNLNTLFEFRDKLESAVQDYHLFNYYYSLENLDCMFTLFKSQILSKIGQLKEAAENLTSLFENKKLIMSHYPIKIAMILKEIFVKSNIQSKDFNQLFQKFDNNITMQVAMIFDCQQNTNLIFKSVQLFSYLINQILNWNGDSFGLILTEHDLKLIEIFIPLMNVKQVKLFQSQIIKEILNIINGDIGQIFDKLSTKIYEDISQFDDSKLNEKESFANQYNLSQQCSQSPLAFKSNALDSIREEKLLLSQEQHPSLISDELNNSKSHLKSFTQINGLKNIIKFRKSVLLQTNKLHNFFKKPQKLSKPSQLESHYGDESIFDSQDIFLADKSKFQQKQTNKKYNFTSEHYFHLSIHKALSNLFSNQVKFEQVNQNLKRQTGEKYTFQQTHKQQRYIMYCTKQLTLKKNYLFFNLCKLLSLLNIQVIILSEIKGKCFIEQQPEQTFIYDNLELFRVYYDGQQIVNFLKNQRNKVNFYSISTSVQHY